MLLLLRLHQFPPGFCEARWFESLKFGLCKLQILHFKKIYEVKASNLIYRFAILCWMLFVNFIYLIFIEFILGVMASFSPSASEIVFYLNTSEPFFHEFYLFIFLYCVFL